MNQHQRTIRLSPSDSSPDGQPSTPDQQPPPRDELDSLLRAWHDRNAEQAAAGRDRLLASLRTEPSLDSPQPATSHSRSDRSAANRPRRRLRLAGGALIALLGMAVLLPFLWPASSPNTGPLAGVQMSKAVAASNVLMVPDGGRLEALDADGHALGPCELKDTVASGEVSGRLLRMNIRQTFFNRHDVPIEAVYTFPMSHNAGIDRMRMVIGDRIVEGEVKERKAAREVYEAARDSGRIASLLEQERPNIFTQSVANILPGATVIVEISYVEMLQPRDGVFELQFPTVVGPRYVPSSSASAPLPMDNEQGHAPATRDSRRGLVLLAPGTLSGTQLSSASAEPNERQVLAALIRSSPAATPSDEDFANLEATPAWIVSQFTSIDGASEAIVIFPDGRGRIGDRWFRCPPGFAAPAPGAPFAMPTDLVPDADRITPMPTRPDTRAGHTIDISITIDTGGPGITKLESILHQIDRVNLASNADGTARRVRVSMARAAEIPNRDFVVQWSQQHTDITDRVLTHAAASRGAKAPDTNGFFMIQLEPPARVSDEQAVPREMVFVVDTSGSMNGEPLAVARQVMQQAMESLRPQDTFNIITFAGATQLLWPQPRPFTLDTKAQAQRFIETFKGSGGTEMMSAVRAALVQPPVDGRSVRPLRVVTFLTDAFIGNEMQILDAIRSNRQTTRVFALGIGNSVNRYLIDQMALLGGGEPDYVYITDQTAAATKAAMARFAERTQTPLLTDIRVQFDGVEVHSVLPSGSNLPDLSDRRPLTLIGRYNAPGTGRVTISGQTSSGPWTRVIPLTLPDREPANAGLKTAWARAKIEQLTNADLAGGQAGSPVPEIKAQIVAIGEEFGVLSQYTSFVAVDQLLVNVGGRTRQIRIPIEMPDKVRWEGIFGGLNTATLSATQTGPSQLPLSSNSAPILSEPLTIKPDALNLLVATSVDSRALVDRRALGDSSVERAITPAIGSSSPSPPSAATADATPAKVTATPAESQAAPGSPPMTSSPASPAPAPVAMKSTKPTSAEPRPTGTPASPSTQSSAPPPSRGRSESSDHAKFGLVRPNAEPSAGGSIGGGGSARTSRPAAGLPVPPGQQSAYAVLALDNEDSGPAPAVDAVSPQSIPIEARPVLLALGAAQLVQADQPSDAQALLDQAAALQKPADNSLFLSEAIDTLRSLITKPPSVERTQAIDLTRTALSQRLLSIKQSLYLRRKLDSSLGTLLLSNAADSGQAAPAISPPLDKAGSPLDTAAPLDNPSQMMLVSMLVSKFDEPTLSEFTQLGFIIEVRRPDIRVLVGRATPGVLLVLASLDSVRRIELVSDVQSE